MKTKYLIVLGPVAEDRLGEIVTAAVEIAPLYQINPMAKFNARPKQMKSGITRTRITEEMKRAMQGYRASGHSSQQIADLMGISRQSVKRHAPPVLLLQGESND